MAAPGWRVIGASVQGPAHRVEQKPCQDASTHRITSKGDLLIVIADGAGSAELAHEGARLAVDQAIAALERQISHQHPTDEADWQKVIEAAFAAASRALESHATAAQKDLQAFATTLTCVAATDATLVTGQLGDSVVVVEAADGSLFTAARPQRGEYANETFFVTLPDALKHVDVQVQAISARALAVTTDGLVRLAMQLPGFDPSPRFFQPLLAFLAETPDEKQARHDLASFLASERVATRTDDDVTLVLALRKAW